MGESPSPFKLSRRLLGGAWALAKGTDQAGRRIAATHSMRLDGMVERICTCRADHIGKLGPAGIHADSHTRRTESCRVVVRREGRRCEIYGWYAQRRARGRRAAVRIALRLTHGQTAHVE